MATNLRDASETLDKAKSAATSYTEQARDKAGEYTEKASQYYSEAAERASQIYDDASQWLSENYGVAIGVGSAVVFGGVIGYLIGKSSEPDTSERISEFGEEAKETALSSYEKTMAPIFKFLKLYMLYRVKV